MTVNNKYNIGDKLYYINSDKKADSGEVTSVSAYVYADHTTVKYWIGDSKAVLDEDECFATESDLKNYVFKDLIEFL